MITCGPRVYLPFQPSASGLRCDRASLESIVEQVGTPTYVYSVEAIRQSYAAIDTAFADYPHAIHYALKANSTLALVRVVRSLGGRADVNSGGELEVALRAGFAPREVVFTGVGKSRTELERAIALDVGTINAESAGELDRVADLADAMGRRARVAVRVNPDIDARSHPNISTGLRTNKFGVALQDAHAIYRERRARTALHFVGLHVHIGSQITTPEPLRRAAATLASLATTLHDDGFVLEHIDLGGGLGISYDGASIVSPGDYAAAVIPELRRSGLPVVLEPGRAIMGHAGALLSRVVDVKQYPDGRRFAVLDAGMTELMRPALYGSFHRIVPLSPREGPCRPWDIVGPICESSDVFARDRELPELQVDDVVAVLDAGAYGAVMASNYNRRPLAAEVLVDGESWREVRRRQTLDDLLALEL
jgi:diaminopimelate decarboxylase